MALPMDMREVLDEFLRKITAFDRTDSIVDHETSSSTGADYTFAGVLLPTSEEDLQLLDEGEIKNGNITIYTRGKQLFFKDVQAPAATAKQTFIKDRDKVYRIKSEADRTEDGMYYKYFATKHIDRGNDPL
jgi:hypothetical protein